MASELQIQTKRGFDMSTKSKYKGGTFCWVDLATPDLASAKDFYRRVFGWDFKDDPVKINGTYSTAYYKEKKAGGVFEMSALKKREKFPPQWKSYITVDDIEESVEKVKASGGRITVLPFDVMEYGRMATVVDHEGASLSLWEPRRHFGAEIVNEANTYCWNELISWDVEAARKFYREVFGWTFEADPTSRNYIMIHNGDEVIGGILDAKTSRLPKSIGAAWSVYFAVDNLEEAMRRVEAAGGHVEVEPMDVNVGRFTVVTDPSGAVFDAIEFKAEAQVA